jgi:Flp pilus assembly protein TadD
VNSDPTNAGAHARLGSALLSRGDSEEEAIRAFDMALKLNPRNAEAKTGKGIVLLRKGDFALAEQLLREALLQSPDPVKIHYELGLLYQKKGSFDQAVAEFKEGISKFQQGRR